jgi:hypothetical protein
MATVASRQPEKERERERHLPITRRVVCRVHSECAKLPGRAQFTVAASPTVTTSFNGWMDDFMLFSPFVVLYVVVGKINCAATEFND